MDVTKRSVSLKLGLGILLAPYLFAWNTLQKGYSKKARIVSFSWLLYLILMLRISGEKHQSMKGAGEIPSREPANTAVFNLPLKHEQEAQALDAITGVENLAVILGRKNPSRVEIFNYVKDNIDTRGATCKLEICKTLKFAMKRLESVAKNPDDMDAIREGSASLKEASREATLLKSKPVYKITKAKPLYKTMSHMAVEYEVGDRQECKLLGDALNIMKKQAVIVFVKAGKTVSKDITKEDFAKISCIYRYSYGLHGYTQVLLESEIAGNWP